MESSVDFKTYRIGTLLHSLAFGGVNRVLGALHIAKLNQMLVHQNLATFDFVVLLDAPEHGVRALLNRLGDSVRQVQIHLLPHVF